MPEKSRNYSLGAVFRFGGFEATVDAYRIDIRDRIVLSENLNTPQVAALIAPFGATVARFFINGVETTTEGIDVVARYMLRHRGLGRFEIIAAGNWNDTEVEEVPSTNVIDNICVGQPADLRTAGVVRAHEHAELRKRHAGQQDQPRRGLDHSARRHESRREPQGHALR